MVLSVKFSRKVLDPLKKYMITPGLVLALIVKNQDYAYLDSNEAIYQTYIELFDYLNIKMTTPFEISGVRSTYIELFIYYAKKVNVDCFRHFGFSTLFYGSHYKTLPHEASIYAPTFDEFHYVIVPEAYESLANNAHQDIISAIFSRISEYEHSVFIKLMGLSIASPVSIVLLVIALYRYFIKLKITAPTTPHTARTMTTLTRVGVIDNETAKGKRASPESSTSPSFSIRSEAASSTTSTLNQDGVGTTSSMPESEPLSGSNTSTLPAISYNPASSTPVHSRQLTEPDDTRYQQLSEQYQRQSARAQTILTRLTQLRQPFVPSGSTSATSSQFWLPIKPEDKPLDLPESLMPGGPSK